MSSPRPERAVVYVRVSTEEQISGTSLDSQRITGNHLALANQLDIAQICEDPGVSGVRYTTRPGIMEALRLIEEGQASVLIATKLDRLGRDARVILEIVERVKRAGGKVITSDFRFDDSIMGRFLTTIFAAIAQLDRDNIIERNTTGLRARAASGRQPNISTPAFGYEIYTKKDLLAGRCRAEQVGVYRINHAKSDLVRWIFESYASGRRVSDICRELERGRVKSPTGLKRWNTSTVCKMLDNETYTGLTYYGKERHVKSEPPNIHIKRVHVQTVRQPEQMWIRIPCPRIVPDDVWDRVRKRKALTQQKPKDFRNKYAFRSVLRCPQCEKPLYATTRPVGVQYACINRCLLSLNTSSSTGRSRRVRYVTEERLTEELLTLCRNADRVVTQGIETRRIDGEVEAFTVTHGLYMLHIALTSPYLTVQERRRDIMNVVQSITRTDCEYVFDFWPDAPTSLGTVVRIPIA